MTNAEIRFYCAIARLHGWLGIVFTNLPDSIDIDSVSTCMYTVYSPFFALCRTKLNNKLLF